MSIIYDFGTAALGGVAFVTPQEALGIIAGGLGVAAGILRVAAEIRAYRNSKRNK